MLTPFYTKQFEKDLNKMLRQGKDKEKIRSIISRLVNKENLDKKNRNHKLTGNYKGRHECHIEPDWLLIYKIADDEIIFERTGTHSQLFK